VRRKSGGTSRESGWDGREERNTNQSVDQARRSRYSFLVFPNELPGFIEA
jgi:hypothetical protein